MWLVIIALSAHILNVEESKSFEVNESAELVPNYVKLLTKYKSKHKRKLGKDDPPAFNGGICVLNYTFKNTTMLFFYWHVWKAGGTTIKHFFEQMVNERIADATYGNLVVHESF